MKNLKNNNLFEIETIGNNVKVEIFEGKKQMTNYWIAKIKKDVFGGYEVISFVKAKENVKVKMFVNIEDGEYVIQAGRATKNDKSMRGFFSVENGEIKLD